MGRRKLPETVKALRRLDVLVRAPKTMAGLVAAVADLGMGQRFVQGWLDEKVAAGQVMRVFIHRGQAEMFVVCSAPTDITDTSSVYPTWLEPRKLPQYAGRRLHSVGARLPLEQEEQEVQEEGSYESPKRNRQAHR